MPDRTTFSGALLARPIAKSDAALDRITTAKKRIQSVLDRDTVAHQKTLEKKIADQGPTPQRVDPHLIGHAIYDLLKLNRLREHRHPATGNRAWLANPGTADAVVAARLEELAPLYASVSGGGLEISLATPLRLSFLNVSTKSLRALPDFRIKARSTLTNRKTLKAAFAKQSRLTALG